MPGFRYCQWCNGKGCIACDAEQKKHEAKLAEKATRCRPMDVRDVRGVLVEAEFERGFRPGLSVDKYGRIDALTPNEVDMALGQQVGLEAMREKRLLPDIAGWSEDQFRYCPRCDGKGCPLCGPEMAAFIVKAIVSTPDWRPPDIRDVRDAAVLAEAKIAAKGQTALTEDDIESLFKPALDAEYARQFPRGPEPMLAVRRGVPGDMDLLKKVFHRDVIEKAFGPGGGGIGDIEQLAAEARGVQSLRHLANPNE